MVRISRGSRIRCINLTLVFPVVALATVVVTKVAEQTLTLLLGLLLMMLPLDP